MRFPTQNLKNMRSNFSLAALVLLASASVSSGAAITGATVFGANAQGAMSVFLGIPTTAVWNTAGGDLIYNLYLQDSSSTFVNSGNGANASLNIPLAPGNYTFRLFAEPGLTTQNYAGLNLFFDGASSPGISGLIPQNATGPLTPDSSSSTAPLTSGFPYTPIPGAGTLSFNDGPFTVTLTSFELYQPDDSGGKEIAGIGNYVSGFNNSPFLRINDYRGEFNLNVVSPEPGSLILLGSGLVAFGVFRRKRAHK